MILEIDVLDRDAAFEWLETWLSQHEYSRSQARCLTVRTKPLEYRERQADPTGDTRPRIFFSPAPGQHFLWYRGRFVIVHRERPKLNQAASQPINVRESFSITIFSRDRKLAQQLLEDARDVAMPPGETRLTIYRAHYASWTEQMQRSPRDPNSVVLRAGQMETLINDARKFLVSRDWYNERGIPYRRGYLLHGPPGTGKSSAVAAVASALRMDIALLSLSNASLDDNELAELMASIPINAVVLIEDVDCAFVQRSANGERTSKITFSGLLNAIDGVAAGEGRILFATTNHVDRLDPALIRPGRIDQKTEIDYADSDQIRRMFLRFFPGIDPSMTQYFVESIPGKTNSPMSAIQNHLIRYADSADDVCMYLDELTKPTVDGGGGDWRWACNSLGTQDDCRNA